MIESMPVRLDDLIFQHVSRCTVNDRQGAIAFGNALNYEEAMENRNKEAKPRLYVEKAFRAELGTIVGGSPSLITALNLVSVVAPTDSNVLILARREPVLLVDREAIKLLALSEANGAELKNCPAYIREWVMREKADTHAQEIEEREEGEDV